MEDLIKTSYEGVSRRDAFRQAKRDAGIPMNQHPRTISRPDLLDGEGNKILNSKGLPIKTRQYEFRDSNNKPVFIQNIVWDMIKQPLVMVLNPISMLGRHKT